ncbi:phosphotransferase [Actinorhabdospora filicis]|uniref:Phosphotransferase n=1 Tax=Actinorhabdospora filicis TaxID=1785913 RepID=A0A9W6WBL5_9ACTN|nr:aminoglycoside phosphotransferase family protein [Actinorhabdospora filicis]GLZ78845.1 phosphotransferase [Actinorhabdospora filicis]
MSEEALAGGGVNAVSRVGDTVRRPTGRHTPAVHALLRHLEAAGFKGAPRVHGFDERGREILDHLDGRVAHPPLPGWASGDEALVAAGRLIRAFHDASVGLSGEHPWMFPAREPAEVICHGDLAPYNCVYREAIPAGLIDFDTAHPGPRVWDLAYAAYRFTPLTDPFGPEGGFDILRQTRRLGLFADAYGLDEASRGVLVETAALRLEALVEHMRARAAAGDAAFAGHIAEGHDAFYLADIAYLRANAGALSQGLGLGQ